MPEPADDEFIASLMDADLYTVGAFFHDRHPDLVDDVVAQAEAIERRGLQGYAARERIPVETAFQTLVTGLAVRYYRAVNR